MTRRITGASLILLAACAGTTRVGGGGKALSYAQYCSLEQGMEAKAVLLAFGPAADMRQEDGKVRGLAYSCEDGSGQARELRMVFTADERLQKWVLRDPKLPASAEAPHASVPRAAP